MKPMNKGIIALFFCLQALPVIGQFSGLLTNQPFDEVIKIDSSLRSDHSLAKLSLIYPNYASKNNIINAFTNRYGVFRNTKGSISWKTKFHQHLKKITLDTTNNCSVRLKFNKNTSLTSKRKVIKEISIDLKRSLMLWYERKINNQGIYFVGHRGGLMDHFQENTNDILKYSKQAGISFMEVDILISGDNIPFIGHDWKHLNSNLGIEKTNDSLAISKVRYQDGQQITFFSTLIAEHQFLILDLIHNSVEEQQRIIQHLYTNFPEAIKTHSYIQVDKLSMFSYIKNLDPNILVSFNVKRENTDNWKKRLD